MVTSCVQYVIMLGYNQNGIFAKSDYLCLPLLPFVVAFQLAISLISGKEKKQYSTARLTLVCLVDAKEKCSAHYITKRLYQLLKNVKL